MDLKEKNKKTPGEITHIGYFAKRKNISRGNIKALLAVLFLVFTAVFFLSNMHNAIAADPVMEFDGCQYNSAISGLHVLQAGAKVAVETITVENCCELAKKKDGIWTNCRSFKKGDPGGAPKNDPNTTNKNPIQLTTETAKDLLDSPFLNAIKFILVGIFNLCSWIFAIASTLFSWVIEPANVSGTNGMLNKQAVKDVWIMVRDLLNMTFILVLLFAAFCTIFQVDSWNLKKVWLNILINALLVNFSFPIARLIIDISNVAFYYFVNHLFSVTGTVTGNAIFAGFNATTKLSGLLMPENYTTYSVAYLVAMIIIVFIMGMTMLVIAGLFVVRLVALTMLVMFSPVGFVGYIFPATHGYADKWWKNLFSYSFFAPIMIFIMAIAVRILEVMGTENFASFSSNASVNAPAEQANWIAQAAFFVIPVIILWMGMGIAKSFGIAGADTIVSHVKKSGAWLANAPGRYSGVYGGTKLGWDSFKKKGVFGTNAIEERSAKFGRLLGECIPACSSSVNFSNFYQRPLRHHFVAWTFSDI